MAAHKTLIFDFDGTLADTFTIAVEVFRQLIGKRYATDDASIEELRGLPAREALWKVGVRWWNMPYAAYRARKAINQRMKAGDVQAIIGMDAVLRTLHQRGYKMFVVSSNAEHNIQQFLRKYGLETHFAAVHGGVGLFAKARTLSKIVAENNLRPEEHYYIGDEVRDIEAARHARLQFVGVTWGFNNRKALAKAGAHTLIDQPQELLRVLSNAKAS
jgi:phosphoglycolate phosphatase